MKTIIGTMDTLTALWMILLYKEASLLAVLSLIQSILLAGTAVVLSSGYGFEYSVRQTSMVQTVQHIVCTLMMLLDITAVVVMGAKCV